MFDNYVDIETPTYEGFFYTFDKRIVFDLVPQYNPGELATITFFL